MALWQQCTSMNHYTSSSSFIITFAADEEPSLASLKVNSDPVVFISLLTGLLFINLVVCGYVTLMTHLCHLFLQGLHLHLCMRAFISLTTSLSGQVQTCFINFNLTYFFFFSKSHIVKACWVCLSAHWTSCGSCLCAFKVLFWSSVCTVWPGVMGNFLMTKLILEGNNIAPVYCWNIHQYDSYLATFYFLT